MKARWISFLNLCGWNGIDNWENVSTEDFNKAWAESHEWANENLKYVPVNKARSAFEVYFFGKPFDEWPKEKQTTNSGFYIYKDSVKLALATVYRKGYNGRN